MFFNLSPSQFQFFAQIILSSTNALNMKWSKILSFDTELNLFFLYTCACNIIINRHTKDHSSVGGVADLRTGGRWFDPRLGQYSFQGLMIVMATGFIPFSPLSAVSTMV